MDINTKITDEEIVILNGILGAMKALKVQGKIDDILLEKYKIIVRKLEFDNMTKHEETMLNVDFPTI